MGDVPQEFYITLYIIEEWTWRWIDVHVRGEENLIAAVISAIEAVKEKYGDCDVRIREVRMQSSVEHLFIGGEV